MQANKQSSLESTHVQRQLISQVNRKCTQNAQNKHSATTDKDSHEMQPRRDMEVRDKQNKTYIRVLRLSQERDVKHHVPRHSQDKTGVSRFRHCVDLTYI